MRPRGNALCNQKLQLASLRTSVFANYRYISGSNMFPDVSWRCFLLSICTECAGINLSALIPCRRRGNGAQKVSKADFEVLHGAQTNELVHFKGGNYALQSV